MILVDTSAWVEYDRATGSSAHLGLLSLIESGAAYAATEPITMEVLAGSSDRRRTRKLMQGAHTIPFESPTDFSGAAQIYQQCRANGSTPRSMIDCMIAAVAIRTQVPLLARDRDFDQIAAVSDLELATF
jgi:predicted nucleic acid-binding protein